MYSAFLFLSILQGIQYLAVSLLSLMNENMNLHCITTAENQTFNERLKSYLLGDETVIRCAGTLSKFVLGEIIGSNLVK